MVVLGKEAVRGTGDDPDSYSFGLPEVTVHDAATLRVRRTFLSDLGDLDYVGALRCADRAGRVVELLVGSAEDETGSLRLVTVDGAGTRSVRVGPLSAAVAGPDGFVAAVGEAKPWVVRIGPDGARRRLARLTRFARVGEIAVSADGRSIAVSGYRSDHSGRVVTLDGRTGARLGEWAGADPLGGSGLAWSSEGRLFVRAQSYGGPTSPLLCFSRDLGNYWRLPDLPGDVVAAIGRGAVVYGYGVPLAAVQEVGVPLMTAEPRLVATRAVAAAPGGSFRLGPPPTLRPASKDTIAARPTARSGNGDGPLVVATAAALLMLAALAALGRRRRGRPA